MKQSHRIVARACTLVAGRRGAWIAGLAVAAMALAPQCARAQYWTGGPTGPIYYNGGNVGIGTSSPATRLDVVADGNGTSPQLRLRPVGFWPSSTSLASYLDFYSTFDNYPYDQGPRRTATIKSRYSGGVWGNETLSFGVGGSNDAAVEPVERMRINANGRVGIGTANPQYLLSVNGTVGARDVIVTNTGWSDYVFRPDYRLRPLSEVAEYIRAHRHLPDIPSEAEVKEKGVSVGEMQAKLLAKVEELTLHMIRAEEENRELRERIARLEKGAGPEK